MIECGYAVASTLQDTGMSITSPCRQHKLSVHTHSIFTTSTCVIERNSIKENLHPLVQYLYNTTLRCFGNVLHAVVDHDCVTRGVFDIAMGLHKDDSSENDSSPSTSNVQFHDHKQHWTRRHTLVCPDPRCSPLLLQHCQVLCVHCGQPASVLLPPCLCPFGRHRAIRRHKY